MFSGNNKPFTLKLAYKTGGNQDSSTILADNGKLSMTDGDDFTATWDGNYYLEMAPTKSVTS